MQASTTLTYGETYTWKRGRESVNGRNPPAGARFVRWHVPLELLPTPLVENTHISSQGRQVVLRDGDAAAVISS
jgi:hypothetical protein